jgi:ABC-type sugar transport system permease subunit
MGHAAALSWMLFLLISLVSALYWIFLRRRGGYA